MTPRERADEAFRAAFGVEPTLRVQAPGRVNLIGEHTDYNDGFVLPCAIDFGTRIAARARSDDAVQVVAADYDGAIDRFRVGADIPHAAAGGAWANYVRGTVQVLATLGRPLRGADLAVAGDVPQGAGLSSSASFEVAVGLAFNALHGLGLDATALALAAQRAENEFVGCNCGIMDQLISARGAAGHALLIDCRSLAAEPVRMPAGLAVMIVHSRVERGLVDSEYNIRRRQCEAAARHFGAPALRDVDLAALQAGEGGLDEVVFRRARHIVSENARTQAAAAALAAGDIAALGRLMAASHASMRDDFEITVPAMDALVAVLQQEIGDQGGARMTGGGFGGCAVALLPRERVDAVRAAVLARYRAPSGAAPLVWVCQPSAGAGTC